MGRSTVSTAPVRSSPVAGSRYGLSISAFAPAEPAQLTSAAAAQHGHPEHQAHWVTGRRRDELRRLSGGPPLALACLGSVQLDADGRGSG
jgi:hypothetical protein